MRTIAIMNNKGGVGKTVTAINLADILTREHSKRVVLADCDGQCNLTQFYKPDFDTEEDASLDTLMSGLAVCYDEVLLALTDKLSLIPASDCLYDLDISALSDAGNGHSVDLRCLIDIRDNLIEDEAADFFILDCPPGFTASSVAALLAADEVVIPMTIDGFSFRGMAALLRQLASMRKANWRLKRAAVLITQYRNAEVVTQGEQLLRSTTGVDVYTQVIRRTDKVPESTIDGSPIWRYSPGSAAARDYRAWVRELLGEEAAHE